MKKQRNIGARLYEIDKVPQHISLIYNDWINFTHDGNKDTQIESLLNIVEKLLDEREQKSNQRKDSADVYMFQGPRYLDAESFDDVFPERLTDEWFATFLRNANI